MIEIILSSIHELLYTASGILYLQANAIGRSAKTVREYLEKNYTAQLVESNEATIKLAIKALLEVVQSGGKNIELAVMERGSQMKVRMFSHQLFFE